MIAQGQAKAIVAAGRLQARLRNLGCEVRSNVGPDSVSIVWWYPTGPTIGVSLDYRSPTVVLWGGSDDRRSHG